MPKKSCIGLKNKVIRLKNDAEQIDQDIKTCKLIVETNPTNTIAKEKLKQLQMQYKQKKAELETAEAELAACEASNYG